MAKTCRIACCGHAWSAQPCSFSKGSRAPHEERERRAQEATERAEAEVRPRPVRHSRHYSDLDLTITVYRRTLDMPAHVPLAPYWSREQKFDPHFAEDPSQQMTLPSIFTGGTSSQPPHHIPWYHSPEQQSGAEEPDPKRRKTDTSTPPQSPQHVGSDSVIPEHSTFRRRSPRQHNTTR